MKPIDFKSRLKFRVAIKFRVTIKFCVAIVVIEMQLNLSEIVSIYLSHNALQPITHSSFENKKNQQIKRALSPGKYGICLVIN